MEGKKQRRKSQRKCRVEARRLNEQNEGL